MSTGRDDFGIAIRSALLQKGAKQKFSLFFLISFSLIIFFLDNYPSKFMDTVRSIFNDGIYRVSSVATSPINLISFLNTSFKKHIFTLNENKILKEKLAELENQKFQNQFLITENKNFKEIFFNCYIKNYTR
jgi:rod shape-determining protein MreC